MAEHSQNQNQALSPSNIQTLIIPFTSRSLAGEITVVVQPNTDAEHACGFDLIFPSTPKSSLAAQFHGFPVLKSTVTYPIPSAPCGSYAHLFGWIQFVKAVLVNSTGIGASSDADDDDASKETGEWEMDIYPYAADLKSPFCFWGYNPTAFDAPSRFLREDGKVDELVWRAQSFLCVLADAGVSKRVRVIKGAGAGWGFDVVTGEDGGRKILLQEPEVLDLEREWRARLGLLRKTYPDWTFDEEVAT